MDAIHLLPFISTAITFVFAAAVLNRFRVGRTLHSLLWGLGLVWYGLGTLAEAYLALWWSPLVLRLWYLSGAMLTAAWLGQGTVYLLIRKPGVAHAFAAGLMLLSVVAAIAVFTAPLAGADAQAVKDAARVIDYLLRFTLGQAPAHARTTLADFVSANGGQVEGDMTVGLLLLITAMPEYQLT